MATQVKHRRGSRSEVEGFTPAIAEIVMNTTDNELVLGDGATQGGVPVAKKKNANFIFPTLNSAIADPFVDERYSIELKERSTGNGGGAMWDVVLANTVTVNGIDIVQCTGVPTLALVLRITEKMDASVFGVIADGVTDYSANINRALELGVKLTLPSGVVVADIIIQDGSVLLGKGSPRYDDTIAADWDVFGTLLLGSINVANKISWAIGNLSVDSFDPGGNSFAGTGARTGYGFIKNVKTRANNHGHLYETATSFNGAGYDTASDVIGNIVVEDCEHWGGPNGFVTKHHIVKFIRCKTWGVTVQGFVAVSDNVNSALVYNRATDSEFEDCYSEGLGLSTGGTEGIRIYTQDRFSADPANDVNTNNVQPCENTKITNYRYSALAGYPVRVGDNNNPSIASLNSIETYVDGLKYAVNSFGAILLQHSSNSIISRSVFGAGANVYVASTASSVIIEDNNIAGPGVQTGAETGLITVTDNAASIENKFWSPGLTYVFNNTSTTTVTSVVNSIRNKPVRLLIDDIYTSINIFASAINYTGKGTLIDAHFDGVSWVVDRVSNVKTQQEEVVAFALTQTFDYVNAESFSLTTEATADWTQINADAIGLADGTILQLYLRAGSVTRNIGAWGAEFKFATAAPLSVGAFSKLVMSFYVRQGQLVEQTRTVYT